MAKINIPTDSLSAIRADLRVVYQRYGRLRDWPFIRSHFWRRIRELSASVAKASA